MFLQPHLKVASEACECVCVCVALARLYRCYRQVLVLKGLRWADD